MPGSSQFNLPQATLYHSRLISRYRLNHFAILNSNKTCNLTQTFQATILVSILIGLIIAAILIWLGLRHLRRTRRDKLLLKPLPPAWIRILERKVSLYLLLPQDLRDELHQRINLFLDEKEFIGCAGLVITEEMRLTIAANACILLLKRDKRCFPGFTSILVYPDTYVAQDIKHDGLVEIHEQSARAGESWERGPVVLSWADVVRGTMNQLDGHNVVLHEFAHKLDEENAIMDGLPVLREGKDYAAWAQVLTREYESLQNSVDHGAHTVLDGYGATSPAEFFAVATETFFEKPLQMKSMLPELYEQLKRFYNLDPADWHNTP